MSRRPMLMAAVVATCVCLVPLGAKAHGLQFAQQPTLVAPITDDTPFWDGATMDAAKCNAGFFLLYPTLASPGSGPCNNQYAMLDFVSPGREQARLASNGRADIYRAEAVSSSDPLRTAGVARSADGEDRMQNGRSDLDVLGRRALTAYVPWPYGRSATPAAPTRMPPLLSDDQLVELDGTATLDANSTPSIGDAEFNALVGEMQAVPEPAIWSLMSLGLGALAFVTWRRARLT